MQPQISDYSTTYRPTWCPGCGNYGIWAAVRRAFVALKLPPHKILSVYDIGCSGNGSNWLKTYAFHSLHGRSLPAAVGAKIANRELTVMCFGGDGGGLGEGGNHFMHTCRTNIDITYIIHDNQLYSLTTGQASPTSNAGMKTKSTPEGGLLEPLHPLQIAISSGATFAARGYADDIQGLSDTIIKAIQHRGFSVVDILQPCVTFNMLNTRDWYKQHIKTLDSTWNPHDKNAALLNASLMPDGKIPIGVIYQEERKTFEDNKGVNSADPLIRQVKKQRVESLIDTFR